MLPTAVAMAAMVVHGHHRTSVSMIANGALGAPLNLQIHVGSCYASCRSAMNN